MSHSEKKPHHHWTTLEEYCADPDVARLKGEEFFEKPQRLFDEMEVARATGRRPDVLSEAAGFAELAVLNHGSANGLSRRDFLKLSAAAAAFATAGCALRPTEKIIPYVKAPDDMVPGVANYYATTLLDAAGTGVLVRTREERPIKIEGNPDHPLSQGKLSAAGQFSIFNLYDPDRLKNPVRIIGGERPKAEAISWQTADTEIGKALADARGKVVVLTGTRHGPARMKVISDFLGGFANADHVMFDAWNYDATRQAQADCYGSAVMPRYRLDRADYFLFLECDPLGSGFGNLQWSVDFGKTRKLRDGKMSKVMVFESYLSQTGCNADERFRIRPTMGEVIASAIYFELIHHGHLPPVPPKKDGKPGEKMDPRPPHIYVKGYSKYFSKDVEKLTNLPVGTIARLADELWEHRGKGLVMGGDSYVMQVAVNLINSICENDGRTVDGTMSPSRQARGSTNDMLALIADMRAGKVDTLIIHDTNPAYWLPESAGFTEAPSNQSRR